MATAVRFENISKSFGPTRVLTGVGFEVNPGEVVALMGENGAGKSTLMKILSGIYPFGDFEGSFTVQGKKAHFEKPLDAEKAGVAIIHQELSFFSHLTVAENLFVGHWPKKAGMVDWSRVKLLAESWLREVGAQCSPDDLMKDLSVGTQQLVEIAKALSRESRILVLDEPTSALSPKEVERLFGLIQRLRAEGCALIYISHKMDEIFHVSDRIVVLRDGQIVGDKPKNQWSREELVKVMVGRELTSMFPPKMHKPQTNFVVEAKDLYVVHKSKKIVGPLTFQIRQGEIYGLGGLLGAGRTELLKALYGSREYVIEGELKVNGQPWRAPTPLSALARGVAYLSEDRKRESVLKKRSLQENVGVSSASLRGLFSIVKDESESLQSKERFTGLKVKYSDIEQDILSLSGGNQQKVILGRILEVAPNIIMLDEPTRGVDVGAKFEIYQILFELASTGKTLIVVSSELPELMGLCDRVLVLREGQDMGVLTSNEMTAESIMNRAFGVVKKNSLNEAACVAEVQV